VKKCVLSKRGKFGIKTFTHLWEINIFVLGYFSARHIRIPVEINCRFWTSSVILNSIIIKLEHLYTSHVTKKKPGCKVVQNRQFIATYTDPIAQPGPPRRPVKTKVLMTGWNCLTSSLGLCVREQPEKDLRLGIGYLLTDGLWEESRRSAINQTNRSAG